MMMTVSSMLELSIKENFILFVLAMHVSVYLNLIINKISVLYPSKNEFNNDYTMTIRTKFTIQDVKMKLLFMQQQILRVKCNLTLISQSESEHVHHIVVHYAMTHSRYGYVSYIPTYSIYSYVSYMYPIFLKEMKQKRQARKNGQKGQAMKKLHAYKI